MVVHPSVEFKAIEGDALNTDRDFSEVWTDISVEPVAVHAEVGWCVAKSDDARLHGGTFGMPHAVPSLVRRVTRGDRPRRRSTATRPASSKDCNARYLALRST
jgi:hypothetical protein